MPIFITEKKKIMFTPVQNTLKVKLDETHKSDTIVLTRKRTATNSGIVVDACPTCEVKKGQRVWFEPNFGAKDGDYTYVKETELLAYENAE